MGSARISPPGIFSKFSLKVFVFVRDSHKLAKSEVIPNLKKVKLLFSRWPWQHLRCKKGEHGVFERGGGGGMEFLEF